MSNIEPTINPTVFNTASPTKTGKVNDRTVPFKETSSSAYKAPGFLSSMALKMGIFYIARFMSSSVRKSVEEHNNKITERIKKSFNQNAYDVFHKKFQEKFGTKIKQGLPLDYNQAIQFVSVHKDNA
jgi:hypothetical protein